MKRNQIAAGLVVAALLACGAGVAGCGVQAGYVAGGNVKLPEGEGSPGYLDRVSSQETISENDAMRGILLLLDGEDKTETFQRRIDALRKRGIVDPSWDFAADRPVTKGKLAYMLYQTCRMDGGLTLTLFGPSERYCLRELQYQGVISSGVFYTPVTGLEFVAILTRADTYMQTSEIPSLIKSAGGP